MNTKASKATNPFGQQLGMRLRELADKSVAFLTDVRMEDAAGKLRRVVDEKMADCRPMVLVYGTYDSGKSTLVNALLGREAARVSDVPETDRITAYEWGSLRLLDSPGLDAPIEHELVSTEKMAEADIILFVLSSGGQSDDRKVFVEMKKVLDLEKPMLIVLNNKDGQERYSDRLIEIRTRILANLSRIMGDSKVEEKYSVHLVNAMSGLKARLEKKDTLLLHSGLQDLENALLREVGRVGKFGLLRAPTQAVRDALTAAEEHLNDHLDQSKLRVILKAQAQVERVKDDVAGDLRIEITQRTAALEDQVRARLLSGGEVQPLVDELCSDVDDIAHQRIAQGYTKIQADFGALGIETDEPLSTTVDSGKRTQHKVDGTDIGSGSTNENRTLSKRVDVLGGLKTLINGHPKPVEEAVKAALLAGRGMKIPFLKGRWEKTLGKWAGQSVRVLGQALTAFLAYRDWTEANRAQEEYEAQERARLQEAVGLAKRIVLDLRTGLREAVRNFVGEAFAEFDRIFTELVVSSKDKEALLRASLATLYDLRAECESILADIGPLT